MFLKDNSDNHIMSSLKTVLVFVSLLLILACTPVDKKANLADTETLLNPINAESESFEIDFLLTPEAAGINSSTIVTSMLNIALNETADSFARGDALLVAGRLTKNSTVICDSLKYYDRINNTNHEEMALVYETSASLGCGRNRKAFLLAAADEWHIVGNLYRANLLKELAQGKNPRINFDKHAIEANDTVVTEYKTPILPNLARTNASAVIIGNTSIILHSNSIILSQNDRVYRDWLSGQMANPFGPDILVTFSERLTYNQTELLPDIGWHEGGRVRDLKKINLTHVPAVGTLAARYENRWFAIDDNGTFRFEVPIDKISYPTTRFLTRSLAVLIDTHGVNMLVEQSIRNKVTAIISDCDHPGKVYAAQYLSQHGIPVACFPDKYVFLALGQHLNLVGSPPITIKGAEAVIGNRPIKITTKDRIVAVNSTPAAYAMWYYQTPASYIGALAEVIPLNITYVLLDDFNQMGKATAKAKEIKANILATRVFNSNDYDAVKRWLDEDYSRKVILFHSAPYPYGQKIFNEYPTRTSFDDPNPIFLKESSH